MRDSLEETAEPDDIACLAIVDSRTTDYQRVEGDSKMESRRNFSLSSREHRGKSMWRTTSILEIKAWTASTSLDSKLRSLTIASISFKSIGTKCGYRLAPITRDPAVFT